MTGISHISSVAEQEITHLLAWINIHRWSLTAADPATMTTGVAYSDHLIDVIGQDHPADSRYTPRDYVEDVHTLLVSLVLEHAHEDYSASDYWESWALEVHATFMLYEHFMDLGDDLLALLNAVCTLAAHTLQATKGDPERASKLCYDYLFAKTSTSFWGTLYELGLSLATQSVMPAAGEESTS